MEDKKVLILGANASIRAEVLKSLAEKQEGVEFIDDIDEHTARKMRTWPEEYVGSARDHFIPYAAAISSDFGTFKGSPYDMNQHISVPDVFMNMPPKLHVFNIKGVDIKAKNRKTAIKIYNLHY